MTAVILSFRPQNIPNVYSEALSDKMKKELTLLSPVKSKDELITRKDEMQTVDVIFSTWGMPALTEEEIEAFFPRVKAVFYAAGTVQAFARPFLARGIPVFSAWAANAVPVAEVVASEILLADKGFFRREVRSRADWVSDAPAEVYPGNYGAKIGIIGAGMIGKLVISLLKRHDLDILVFDPFLPDEKAAELGVTKTDLHTLFASCHVISNHLANNAQTKGMIDRSCFELMDEHAVFINTGRGAQVVERDLIEAMKNHPGRLALLDVTDPNEPPAEGSELYTVPNIRITPHIAGSIGYEVRRLADTMWDEYHLWINGQKTRYEVTAKMLETMA